MPSSGLCKYCMHTHLHYKILENSDCSKDPMTSTINSGIISASPTMPFKQITIPVFSLTQMFCVGFPSLRQDHMYLRLAPNYVAEDDHELLIPLTSCPECWEHQRVPPYPVYTVLGVEPPSLCMPGNFSINSAPVPNLLAFALCFYQDPYKPHDETQWHI